MSILETRSGQDYRYSDPMMIHDTSSSQDAYTHQIWNFYLEYYKRYAPDTINLNTRSKIKVKVTVTRKWYATLSHPKMHKYIKFGIPISKNIGYAPESMPILETRSEVKSTVTQVWYATLCHPKMHAHTKFGIPTSNNIRDMFRTWIFLKLGQRSRSQ